ncbi:hypothetical protein AYO38_09885 [bacterium SCGC AG-212-C10]|nr:hypothetical protein AYO38_09885 [bacterium SCGC AG-212-C10]
MNDIDRPAARFELLTERQREVLRLVARGWSNQQIADELGVSLDGAKWHLREIFARLGVDSREEAARLWSEHSSASAKSRRAAKSILGWLTFRTASATLGAVGLGAITVAVVAMSLGSDTGTTSASPPPGASPAPTTATLRLRTTYVVAGNAMSPTLADGQEVPFDALAYVVDSPQRGDIIVFAHARKHDEPLVKRVIALPGETVEVRFGYESEYGAGIPGRFTQLRGRIAAGAAI